MTNVPGPQMQQTWKIIKVLIKPIFFDNQHYQLYKTIQITTLNIILYLQRQGYKMQNKNIMWHPFLSMLNWGDDG